MTSRAKYWLRILTIGILAAVAAQLIQLAGFISRT